MPEAIGDLPTAQGKAGAFAELMEVRGLGAPAAGEATITGNDPFYRTPLRVGETAAAVLAATGVAANDLWEGRTGRRQQVSVDVRQAAATLRTVDYTEGQKPDGSYEHIPIPQGMKEMIAATQPWPTRDGAWVLPHLNLPHLKDRVLGVLGAEFNPSSVKEAVGRWDADALEEAIAAVNGCGGRIRSPEDWLAHPQGQYLAARPVVEITKLRDGPPVPMGAGDRPASGVRVLDFTRILAGPIGGRTLAEHGAEVLMVTAPHLPQTPEHVRDTSHGKRSCFLDLRDPTQAARAQELARQADIVIGGYRPGRLAANGLGPEITAEQPGRIYLTISCFGSGGPFAGRSGWEQVAQVVSGVAHVHGKAIGDGTPKLVFAPVCDYLTGYLAGYGALLALGRRMREGGSYHVNVSLCQSAMLLLRQGTITGFEDAPERLTRAEIDAMHVTADTSYGRLKTIGPVLRMSETPPHWARPTPALGGDAPGWIAA
ncbi:CoA transferase [Roseomonas sp. HJA6]|uniref:CoA transferase n=1 Tax=Roseomonas alba TaxID=2846776 RepID=A0ABS7A405_9PROT|nr:CoA transferase [Neoroseomonas alba]MBW6396908.1 CoA transferase [Neoroseomonas alba]